MNIDGTSIAYTSNPRFQISIWIYSTAQHSLALLQHPTRDGLSHREPEEEWVLRLILKGPVGKRQAAGRLCPLPGPDVAITRPCLAQA